MFTLRLFLMGLIGLVPVGDGFFFVLPNVQNHETMKHFPVLVCNPVTTDCSASGGPNQWDDIKSASKLALGVNDRTVGFLLNGERLELAGASPGPLEKPPAVSQGPFGPFRGACPKDQQEARSLSWLPDLSGIEPQAAVIDPAHIFQPTAAKVAAVLPLFVAGKLQSFRFSVVKEEGGKKFVHSLTFRRPGEHPMVTVRHAAPDVLEVVIKMPAEPAQIHLRSFSGAGAGRTLTIRPHEAGGEAVVLLGNLTPPLAEIPQQPVGSVVAHFGLYYGLSKDPQAAESSAGLKLPHVGKLRVLSTAVNPIPLPRVLVMVSAHRPEAGGVERPICTFAGFTLPRP